MGNAQTPGCSEASPRLSVGNGLRGSVAPAASSGLHVEWSAAFGAKYTTRPARYGPLSSAFTVAVLPLLRSITFAVVPPAATTVAASQLPALPRVNQPVARRREGFLPKASAPSGKPDGEWSCTI